MYELQLHLRCKVVVILSTRYGPQLTHYLKTLGDGDRVSSTEELAIWYKSKTPTFGGAIRIVGAHEPPLTLGDYPYYEGPGLNLRPDAQSIMDVDYISAANCDVHMAMGSFNTKTVDDTVIPLESPFFEAEL
ncbi:hypothetical protein H112_03553 [Trichophyton rubrum D6]|uniref:Uncharacterized protein n=1 Tax=Trichophyton soudanense CBS 452.61 TaxID=1215331 RepID=A0A022XVP9_TRISD|nr:hypothetical protein H105_03575 [Trichophyton soudanense CBS 452.61]KDB34686.1 hypothetical protein H112_03553 [Trichophyton rubrum D6]